jgi:hypothetical protein
MNGFAHEYAVMQTVFWLVMLALSIHYVRGAIDKASGVAICAIAAIQFALALALGIVTILK